MACAHTEVPYAHKPLAGSSETLPVHACSHDAGDRPWESFAETRSLQVAGCAFHVSAMPKSPPQERPQAWRNCVAGVQSL